MAKKKKTAKRKSAKKNATRKRKVSVKRAAPKKKKKSARRKMLDGRAATKRRLLGQRDANIKAAEKQLAASDAADKENARLERERKKSKDGTTASERTMASSSSKARRVGEATVASATAAELAGTLPAAKAHRAKSLGRISLASRGQLDADQIRKATAGQGISLGHIAYGLNGGLHEFYYRLVGKTPIIWKASTAWKIDKDGYRSNSAQMIVSGVSAVRAMCKQLIGKTPSSLGITLGTGASKKTGDRPARGPTLIDAAASVMSHTQGRTCRLIVDEILKKKLYATKAKNPATTLSGCLLQNMRRRGDESRFVKTGPGLFRLREESAA